MAAFDFPPNASHPAAPALGDKWPQPPVPGLPVYTWDGEKWTTKGGATGSTGVSDDLPLMDGVANAGASLQWSRGDHVHPTDTSHVAKTYVDAQDALKLDKTGGTLTGPLFFLRLLQPVPRRRHQSPTLTVSSPRRHSLPER